MTSKHVVAQTREVSERVSYENGRPTVLPDRLGDLSGLTHGVIDLPLSVAWTGRRRYDLDVAEDRVVLYERVIVEATSTTDLTSLLDRELLEELWHLLYRPRQTRSRWQARFPHLTTAA